MAALRDMVGNGGDINLYAPDLRDIKLSLIPFLFSNTNALTCVLLQKCGKETLECFQNELSVLDFEFDGTWKPNVSELIDRLNFSIEYILSHLNATRGCQQCEIYQEESASTFFRRLETFLQYQNRFTCSAVWF
ncbi:interleukin 15, like isoform X1 [Rhinoraja longicauda]